MPASSPLALKPGAANTVESKGRKPKQRRVFGKQVKAARQRTGLAGLLLDRNQVVALVGFSYPTIWQMMRRGAFPRGGVVSSKTMWLASEIETWLAALPVSPLRSDSDSSVIQENAPA